MESVWNPLRKPVFQPSFVNVRVLEIFREQQDKSPDFGFLISTWVSKHCQVPPALTRRKAPRLHCCSFYNGIIWRTEWIMDFSVQVWTETSGGEIQFNSNPNQFFLQIEKLKKKCHFKSAWNISVDLKLFFFFCLTWRVWVFFTLFFCLLKIGQIWKWNEMKKNPNIKYLEMVEMKHFEKKKRGFFGSRLFVQFDLNLLVISEAWKMCFSMKFLLAEKRIT